MTSLAPGRLIATTALLIACCFSVCRGALVTQESASRAGLTRAWFAQAAVDTSRHTVAGAQIEGDTLYVVTSAGAVQAFDAESGRSRWVTRLGRPGQPMHGPSHHDGRVAFVSGSTLYLLDDATGAEVVQRELAGAPGAAPALASDHCFVPLLNGRMAAYPLSGENQTVWNYATGSRVFDPPKVVGDFVVWTTTEGELFGSRSNARGIEYRFQGTGRLVAPAASIDETLFIPSASGLLYAIDGRRGVTMWRASVGIGVRRPANVAAGVVYLGTEEPSFHAFDASTGAELWSLSGVDRFVSRSADRVYAVDQTGSLAVIDQASGRVTAHWSGTGQLTPVANSQSDRLYFVSPSGLVQCFHEPGLEKPLYHAATPAEEMAAEGADEPVAEADTEAPAEGTDAVEEEDPGFGFGDPPAEEAPAESPDDDPFGDPFGDF